jgi:selenocysteine lyase/cysteine desulfurase
VITVQYNPVTGVCLADLSRLLSLYSSRSVKVGAFSAASNVTGVLTAANAVSALMHRAGGLVFFDYATAAPYVKVISLYLPFINLLGYFNFAIGPSF